VVEKRMHKNSMGDVKAVKSIFPFYWHKRW